MRRGVPSDRGELLACEIFQIMMNYNKKEINHSLQATSYGRYAEGLCGIMNACLRMLFLGEAALSYSAVPRSQASAPSRESGYRRPCAPICEDWLTLPRQSAAPSWLLSTASDSPPPLYRAEPDPYCYEGSEILKNKAGLTDSAALKQFETAMTFARAHEPLPRGRFSVSHYRAVHRHLFQDVYRWAGAFRTVRLSKGGNVFQAEYTIGTVANFYKPKGLEYLIEAIKFLPEKMSAILVIIGEGRERKYLEGLIVKNNLQSKIFMIGALNNAFQYLKAFDVFVLPSVKEGFPWSLLEAMAAKLPIIATSVGAIPEVLESGKNGILIEPKNSKAIAESITTVLSNDKLRQELGIQAHQTVLFKFSLEKMVREVEDLL